MPHPEQIRILAVLAFIGFAVYGMKKPLYGVIGYMILVYAKLSAYYPVFGSIRAELLFGLIFLVRANLSLDSLRRLSWSYNKVNLYLYVFTGTVFLSYIFAWDHAYSWDIKVYHYIKVLVLYFMLLPSLKTLRDVKIFSWSFVLFYVYLSYEPFYGFFHQVGGQEYHYGVNYISEIGILSGHVALANNMNQMIPLAFYLIFTVRNTYLKMLSVLPVLIFFGALVGSGSRGGVAGFGIFSIVVAYYTKQRIRNFAIMIVLFLVILAGSGSLSRTASRIDSDSAWGRFVGLTHGFWIMVRGNPIGVGPGCYLLARERYFSYRMESHNLYGQVMGDLGIPGTVAWFVFIFYVFRNVVYTRRSLDGDDAPDSVFLSRLAVAIQVSLIVRLAVSMASHGLYFFYWYVMAALAIAVFEATRQKESETETEDEGHAP